MEKVVLEKQVFGKNTYKNVINTQFTQLIKTAPTEPQNMDTVENFFRLYDLLFYDINKNGTSNSHEYLIKESTNYLGISQVSEDVQALLDEIAILRQESLDKDKTIITLTTQIAEKNSKI